jgi:hypothetical protein
MCVKLAHWTAVNKWSSSFACKLCLTTLCYTAVTERSPMLGGDDYNRDFHSLSIVLLPARYHRLATNNPQRLSLTKAVDTWLSQSTLLLRERQHDCAGAYGSTLEGKCTSLMEMRRGQLTGLLCLQNKTCDAWPRTSKQCFKGWVTRGI